MLDLTEDHAASRFVKEEEYKEMKREVHLDVLRNIPKDYAVECLTFSLNTINPEKVNSYVMQSKQGKNYFMDSQLCKHYCVQCRIYPFPNRVQSVRIVVARISKKNDKQDEKQQERRTRDRPKEAPQQDQLKAI